VVLVFILVEIGAGPLVPKIVAESPARLVGTILCPVGFEFDGGTCLAIELTITNNGPTSTVHGFRTILASNDGRRRIIGSSFRVDSSFAVNYLPDQFHGRRTYPISSWLEKTLSVQPIVRHTTSLAGFFVAKFDSNPFTTLPEGFEKCHLEVDFCDVKGRRSLPASYSETDENGALLIGFGRFEAIT
jgi:hypothetical protein